MIIKTVAITGADNSINPEELIPLTKEFPFVEWGILLSNRNNRERYPSEAWLRTLPGELPLSGHLCGGWVRDLVMEGTFTALESLGHTWPLLKRVQINAGPYWYKADKQAFFDLLKRYPKEYIFQQVHPDFLKEAQDQGINASPLFDKSGGRGNLPASWPKPISAYCGYAGGLGPDTLKEELPRIAQVTQPTDTIWIDMESRVRSATTDEDRKDCFDLEKVRECLEITKPWVENGQP
jgi:hypothetical protein